MRLEAAPFQLQFGELRSLDSRGRLSLPELFHRLRRGKPRLYRSDYPSFSVSVVVERRAMQGRSGNIGNAQPYGVHQSPGILKFLATVQADLVRPFLDCEHGSPFAVMASEGKLEHLQEWFHKSSARFRRSQLPWASSQSTRERTLARARASEQDRKSVV